jgi:phage terminase small subunit
MANELTPQQELFVAEYLKDLNATQAAIRAGYGEAGAHVRANELRKNPLVAAQIDAALAARNERVQIDADFVLRELFKLASCDLAAAFDEFGNLRNIHDIPPDVRKAISGVEVEDLFAGRGPDREQIGVTRKVKFWDKTRALEMLGRHLALFKDRLEVSVDASLTDELRAARERAAGFDLA